MTGRVPARGGVYCAPRAWCAARHGRARATEYGALRAYPTGMASPLLSVDAPTIGLRPSYAAQVRGTASALLEAMRPRQWLKNVFVFAGIVFGGRLFDAA